MLNIFFLVSIEYFVFLTVSFRSLHFPLNLKEARKRTSCCKQRQCDLESTNQGGEQKQM